MGWLGKGLSRGGIVPHGRGNDPEQRAVGLPHGVAAVFNK